MRDRCIIWPGATDAHGYGIQKVAGRSRLAHRVAYERQFGPIAEGMVIDHLCRVRNCVNPAHMEVVTPRINTLRGVSIPALNAQKTSCKHGHDFTPENTLVRVDGGHPSRRCRTCIVGHRRARRLGIGIDEFFALPEWVRAMPTRQIRAVTTAGATT